MEQGVMHFNLVNDEYTVKESGGEMEKAESRK